MHDIDRIRLESESEMLERVETRKRIGAVLQFRGALHHIRLYESHITYRRLHGPNVDDLNFTEHRHVRHKPVETASYVNVAVGPGFVN